MQISHLQIESKIQVTMKKITRRSNCPVAFALDIFGDKWSLLIVRDIMFSGKKSYGEFLSSDEHIATNILAQRLAWLECAQIINKTVDPQDKRKDIYSLTPKGLDFLPVMLEIVQWSAKYDPDTGAPKEFVAQLTEEKEQVARRLREGIEKGKFAFKKD